MHVVCSAVILIISDVENRTLSMELSDVRGTTDFIELNRASWRNTLFLCGGAYPSMRSFLHTSWRNHLIDNRSCKGGVLRFVEGRRKRV